MSKYTNHKTTNHSEIIKEIKNCHFNKETKYIAKILRAILPAFDQMNITKYPDLITIFKKFGIKTADQFLEIINEFISIVNIDFLKPKSRTLRKTSMSNRNVVLCYFLLKFYPNFIFFVNTTDLIKLDKEEKESLILILNDIYDQMRTHNNTINQIPNFGYLNETNEDDFNEKNNEEQPNEINEDDLYGTNNEEHPNETNEDDLNGTNNEEHPNETNQDNLNGTDFYYPIETNEDDLNETDINYFIGTNKDFETQFYEFQSHFNDFEQIEKTLPDDNQFKQDFFFF